jgi:hypothetical protein
MATTNFQAFSGDVEVASNLQVGTANLFVDITTGQVGIGKTNPTQLLDIAGNVAANVNTLFVDTVTSRVGIGTSNPSAPLEVSGNVTVGSTLTVSGFRITAAAAATDDLQAITTAGGDTDKQIHITNATRAISSSTGALRVGDSGAPGGIGVVGNVYVGDTVTTQDLSVDNVISDFAVNTDDFFVDISESKVGVSTTQPHAELHVVGNVYVSSNLTVDADTLHVDAANDRVGVNTKNPEASLHLVGNVYVSSNLTVDADTLHVDAANDRVGVNTKNPEASLHLVGNAYVSSNLEVGTADLFVDTVNSRVGIGTTSPNVLLELSSATGSATITPTELRLSSSTDAGDWDTATPYARLAFYTGDVTADAPGVMASIGAVASSVDGGENTRLAFFTAEPHVERICVDRYGNVGIGTTDPNTLLDVKGTILGSVVSYSANQDAAYLVAGTSNYTGADTSWDTHGFQHRIAANSSGSPRIYVDAPSGGEVFTILTGGNVGIGTSNPRAKLTVIGSGDIATASGQRSYFAFTDSALGTNAGYWNPASIYGSESIVSGSHIASVQGVIGGSDERIKKDITDVDDGSALETLRLLKPKKYKYKDVINRGDEPVWGFIAQEVGATLPYTTQLRTECIPNIYELANVSDSNVITFTNFDTSTLESNAMVLKVYDVNDTEHLVNIAEVIDGHSIRVGEDLGEWIGSLDETGNVIAGNQIFVYGQEVDDFVFLKKEAIFTVATAALQEIDRQLQAEKARNDALEARIAALESA